MIDILRFGIKNGSYYMESFSSSSAILP